MLRRKPTRIELAVEDIEEFKVWLHFMCFFFRWPYSQADLKWRFCNNRSNRRLKQHNSQSPGHNHRQISAQIALKNASAIGKVYNNCKLPYNRALAETSIFKSLIDIAPR